MRALVGVCLLALCLPIAATARTSTSTRTGSFPSALASPAPAGSSLASARSHRRWPTRRESSAAGPAPDRGVCRASSLVVPDRRLPQLRERPAGRRGRLWTGATRAGPPAATSSFAAHSRRVTSSSICEATARHIRLAPPTKCAGATPFGRRARRSDQKPKAGERGLRRTHGLLAGRLQGRLHRRIPAMSTHALRVWSISVLYIARCSSGTSETMRLAKSCSVS